MKVFRTGTSKVNLCDLGDTSRLHSCTIFGHLKLLYSFAVENESLRGSRLESWKGYSPFKSVKRIHDVGRRSYL
jgi:hypothetical protein